MTVHASKGLEFPVVAVAECDGISNDGDALQAVEREGRTYWSALPNRFDLADDADMLTVPELDEDNVTHEVPERAAEAFAYMKRENRLLDYEEAARLLYVAITRAREVAILAFGVRFATELVPEHPTSLVGEVLSRILPVDQGNDGLPDLGAGRLDFSDSKEGDFQLIALSELNYPAKKGVHRTYSIEEFGPDAGVDANGAAPEGSGLSAGGEGAGSRHVAIVTPAAVDYRLVPAERSSRASYSYSSISRELHAEAEDRDVAVGTPQGEGSDAADSGSHERSSSQAAHAGDATDATNLGSVVHDACQWMIETGSDEVPVERVDALCRYWGCTSEQRVRIDAAIDRWRGSKVRAEALRWPCVRAEVPFYSRGMEELGDRFGAYAEGAIDLLCTDPSDSGHALVIDYKTGGHADETPEQLREKHALQARVYADVLHKQGYGHVTLKFVRVEQPDPTDPTQPQVVTYNL